jgi:hypothetical protein
MPVHYSVNIAYQDVYDDFATIDTIALSNTVPTKMALELVAHFTAQIHTLERDPQLQIELILSWIARFTPAVARRVRQTILQFQTEHSNFGFFNNISSLYSLEFLLAHPNTLPVTEDLSATQEENIFKLYLYFSSQWTTQQTAFVNSQNGNSTISWILALMAPFEEIVEFKDFRIQFIKAIYFFRFCETDAEFAPYLIQFLAERHLPSWQQYLVQILTMYAGAAQNETFKTVVAFQPADMHVFQAFEHFFCAPPIAITQDFLEIRKKPLYRYAPNEVLIISNNFLIDKLFQGILFDMGSTLIRAHATYRGRQIQNFTDFIGIFSDDFVEKILFYRVMQFTFRRNSRTHYSGEQLENQFENGTPDYILIDKSKVYVIEFKNALFSANAKYSYDPAQISQELHKKFVANVHGRPKGVTQLANFMADVIAGRYNIILPPGRPYTFYPIIVTTDHSFNLPTVNQTLDNIFASQIAAGNFRNHLTIKPLTLICLDDLIKFQDLFKTMRLSMHRELDHYQLYLQRGADPVERAISFSVYLHNITRIMNYNTPKIFETEILRLMTNP